MRITGKENQLWRDKIGSLINRKQGRILGAGADATTAGALHHNAVAPHADNYALTYFVNPDGSIWTPQNSDGSFAYLPGMDGPLA